MCAATVTSLQVESASCRKTGGADFSEDKSMQRCSIRQAKVPEIQLAFVPLIAPTIKSPDLLFSSSVDFRQDWNRRHLHDTSCGATAREATGVGGQFAKVGSKKFHFIYV